MIFVSPGSPMGFRFAHDFRNEIIKRGGHIIAPCPHSLECPLAKEGYRWCHFA